jgi:hypothetical protein
LGVLAGGALTTGAALLLHRRMTPYWLHKAVFHRGRKDDAAWGVSVTTVPSRKITEEELHQVLVGVCECDRLRCCVQCRVPTGGGNTGKLADPNDHGEVSFYFLYLMAEYSAMDVKRSYRSAATDLGFTITELSYNDADRWGGDIYLVGVAPAPEPEDEAPVKRSRKKKAVGGAGGPG